MVLVGVVEEVEVFLLHEFGGSRRVRRAGAPEVQRRKNGSIALLYYDAGSV